MPGVGLSERSSRRTSGKDLANLDCLHPCCRACLQRLVQVNVADGALAQLSCPEPKCRRQIPPGLLKEMLSAEEFERWERIALDRALAAMGDVCYCPRCQAAVLKEPGPGAIAATVLANTHSLSRPSRAPRGKARSLTRCCAFALCCARTDPLAQCASCHYAFCTSCADSWHPGRGCLGAEERSAYLEDRIAKLTVRASAPQTAYLQNIPPVTAVCACARSGPKSPPLTLVSAPPFLSPLQLAQASAADRVRLIQQKNELASLAHIRSRGKPCPRCSAVIIKDGGCQKV